MNAKRTMKKILALGAGATMVGATIMGAMAYDLATYPAPFVTKGVFDGQIVLGSSAMMEDLIGAVDISTSIQAKSISKKPIDVPGNSGTVSLEGDTFQIKAGADKLELREPVGDVVDTITGDDLAGLKSGYLSTSEGDTDYYQYLRLQDNAALEPYGVNMVENDDNVLGDYLVIDTSLPFLIWEMQFPEGFESERSTATSTLNQLRDFEDRTLNVLGQDFTVVRASVSSLGEDFEMLLMGGSAPLTLKEGESKVISLNGVDHEVTLIFVSDPSSGGDVEAKFMVDKQQTRALGAGDTETLAGGMQIGIRDILVNNRDGVASFFLGADKLLITDGDTNDADDYDGSMKVNQESVSDGEIAVLGAFTDATNTTFEINSIKYRLTMDATDGGTAYVPKGEGIRGLMDKPEALVSDSLDIKYEGLETVEKKDVKLASKSDDKYQLTFTNIQGKTYTFPYISNDPDATTLDNWKFGDEDYEFVFVEGTSATDYNIGRRDYFAVSDERSAGDEDKSVSNVLRYEDFDPNTRTVDFRDLATGNTIPVVVSSTTPANGVLTVGGQTYDVYVINPTLDEPVIAVDLTGDDAWNDIVTLTTWGGGYLNLAAAVEINSTLWLTSAAQLQTIVGDATGVGNATGWGAGSGNRDVNMTYTIDSSLFDTSTGNEVMMWHVSQADNNEIDMGFDTLSGPLVGSAEYNKFEFTDRADDDDHQVGLSTYGVMVDEYNPSGTSTPNELTLSVPKAQVFAQVFVTMGSTTTNEGGAMSADQVNPIAVGLAVLDKNAAAVGSKNQIVVGGPCVNSVAAQLMGIKAGDDCAAGFTPGKALIKSFETSGKVAILVAGYEAQDTQGASRVLANYGDYTGFKGSEVEVVVPSLSAITVQAVTPKTTE